ncbi:MAG: redoxin domain-containing protein [Deltaproteobacteria bacterium]|nr:redoxin domain-containing protein [Deltaproteobacteria bacterium]
MKSRWLLVFVMMFQGCAVSEKTRELISPVCLPRPAAAHQAAYLGLFNPGESFGLNEIRARILVIEVFQSDCSLCRLQVDELRELYRLLEREALSGLVKIIGLGYGDDLVAVEEFARRSALPYPLFADPRGEYVGVDEIPVLFVLALSPEGARVLYEFHGPHPSAAGLVRLIREALAA